MSHVVEDRNSLKVGAAPTISEFLQHQAADACRKQAVLRVGKESAEYTIDNNSLAARVTPVDSAVQLVY